MGDVQIKRKKADRPNVDTRWSLVREEELISPWIRDVNWVFAVLYQTFMRKNKAISSGLVSKTACFASVVCFLFTVDITVWIIPPAPRFCSLMQLLTSLDAESHGNVISVPPELLSVIQVQVQPPIAVFTFTVLFHLQASLGYDVYFTTKGFLVHCHVDWSSVVFNH